MAFPSGTGARTQLALALSQVQTLASQIKSESISIRDRTAAGSVFARLIVNYVDMLAAVRARLAALSATPGLAAYARAQFDDESFDISTEYTAMLSQIDATITWVGTNIPKDAGNRWLAVEELVGGVLTARSLTSANTATLRTQLNLLIAAID